MTVGFAPGSAFIYMGGAACLVRNRGATYSHLVAPSSFWMGLSRCD
jgi:hypothetical protein